MDLDYLLRAAQFIFTVAVGLFSISAARKASSKAEAEQLAMRLSGQDNRITVLEQRLDHLPGREQLSELANELADLAGDMKAIKVEISGVAKALDPLTRSVDRINDFLLKVRP